MNHDEMIVKMDKQSDAIANALTIAWDYAQIDGEHHKMWVIDQMVRALCGTEEKYKEWVNAYQEPFAFEDFEGCYEWDIGIAP